MCRLRTDQCVAGVLTTATHLTMHSSPLLVSSNHALHSAPYPKRLSHPTPHPTTVSSPLNVQPQAPVLFSFQKTGSSHSKRHAAFQKPGGIQKTGSSPQAPVLSSFHKPAGAISIGLAAVRLALVHSSSHHWFQSTRRHVALEVMASLQGSPRRSRSCPPPSTLDPLLM